MVNTIPTLLYDTERDKDLQAGEAILVFEDGSTRRVRESSTYPKEEVSVRQPIAIRAARSIGSRSTGATKRRDKHTKQTSTRKRTAIYQTRL